MTSLSSLYHHRPSKLIFWEWFFNVTKLMSTKSNNKATFVRDFLYNAHRSVKSDDGKNCASTTMHNGLTIPKYCSKNGKKGGVPKYGTIYNRRQKKSWNWISNWISRIYCAKFWHLLFPFKQISKHVEENAWLSYIYQSFALIAALFSDFCNIGRLDICQTCVFDSL